MKWNKRILLAAVFFIAAAVYSVIQLIGADVIKQQYTCVSVRFQKDGVTEEMVKTALDKEKERGTLGIPEVTAWSKPYETRVKNNSLNRSAVVRVQIVSGEMSLTAPMTLLYGNYAYREDKKGCVIDSRSAFLLYGTENAVGNNLSWDGKEYCIRGVVRTTDALLLVQGKELLEEYSNLEVVYQNREQGEELTNAFLLNNNFPPDYVVYDGWFYGGMIKSALALPVWLLLAAISLWIIKTLRKKKSNLTQKAFLLYAAASAITIILYGSILYQFTGAPFFITDKLLPTRFSDFGYWGEQYRLMREQWRQVQFAGPNGKDILLEKELIETPLTVTVMCLFYLVFCLQVKLAIRSYFFFSAKNTR
ncbi:ABC transporter permease [Anaerocolumna xylanovorans]|uniref:MacB-like core domain-containing protein n=1 Tax=Anaerocolumna xylanovorans DSM 12503 TaxID=1121345 RepID=A0A1M7YNH9_9FIRM|nr:ABC transporter permease [Anaerocolumna xylanovorans]SHO54213.1 hypothetical protein SAMN02745217_04670 [Anaerocolumna xylanovorans DSM 12503]